MPLASEELELYEKKWLNLDFPDALSLDLSLIIWREY